MNIREIINILACGSFIVGSIYIVFSMLYHCLIDFGWMTTFVGGILLAMAGAVIDFCTNGAKNK